MSKTEFTIILPTTGNRGALLPYSVGSIQNQTNQNFELFIIGDGVTEEAKKIIYNLKGEDPRITFFDHPKHERRGEVYRHQALKQAKGKYVAYICDRDLWLPKHLETMKRFLSDYNFVSTTFINVREDQSVNIGQYIGYYGAASEHKGAGNRVGISLSNACHTLDLYNRLPYGWRTTPKGKFTDIYMWAQFHSSALCNAYSHPCPTVLYFKRGHFPGISVSERQKELAVWSEKIKTPDDIQSLVDEAYKGLLLEWRELKNRSRSAVLIKGNKLKDVPGKIIQKVSSRLKKL